MTPRYDIFDVNTQVRHVYTMSNICLSNRRDLATVEAYIDKGGTMASSATTNDPKDGSSEGQVVEMPDATPGRDGLTERQRIILTEIRRTVAARGYPPSVREIGEVVGLTSPSSVNYQLKALERKGYIRRDPHRPRALEVLLPDEARRHRQWRRQAPPDTYRSSGGSRQAVRFWPRSRWRVFSHFPQSWWVTGSCSCLR